MRRRPVALLALHASMMGGVVALASSIPGCFPDPPTDDGLLDSGIFISDGTVITPVPDGATSGLTLSSSTIDFGLNECGGVAPKNQTLTLTNTSSGTVTYGVGVAGLGFAIAATGDADDSTTTTGTIPARQSVSVAISAQGVSTFATAGGLIEGALQVVTNAPGQKLFVVDLKETAAGAQLTMIPNMNGSEADFGVVAQNAVAQLDVSFRNNGNEPLTIAFDDVPIAPFTLETEFVDDAGAGFTIPANSTKTLKATFTNATGDDNTFDVIGFHATGVQCGGGEPPSSVRMSAQEGFGGVSIVPGILTFDVGGVGYVPCGKIAAAQKIVVTNAGGEDIQIVSTDVTGPFTVSPGLDPLDAGMGINVPHGGNVSLTVTPQTVNAPQSTASDGVSGSLQIGLSTEQSLTVKLSQTAQGAVLSFASPSIHFPSTALDIPSFANIGITNSGNAAVGLTLAVTGSPYFTVSPASNFSVNTPFGEATAIFLPIAAGPAQGTLSLVPSGAVCSLPLAGLSLSGNGATDGGAPDDSGSPVVDAGADAD